EGGDGGEPLVEHEHGVRVAEDEPVAAGRDALGAARPAAWIRVDVAPRAFGHGFDVCHRVGVEIDDANVAGEGFVSGMADGRGDHDPGHARFLAKTWKNGPTASSVVCTGPTRRARL